MSKFKDLHNITLHFSSILGATVKTENGQKLGKFVDFFVDYQEMYPQVLAIQYLNKGQYFYIDWEDVLQFTTKSILTKEEGNIGRSRTYPKVREKKMTTSLLANQFTGETLEYPALGKVILDKQVVDTSGKKVVRVNDIQFLRSGESLRVTHAEVGLRSMIRRIGFETSIDRFLNFFNIKASWIENDSLINWKFVHAIPSKNIQNPNVKLNLSNDDIKKLHPADIADILEDLDGYGREVLLDELDPLLAAQTLQEVDLDIQKVILKNESPEDAARIIENMDTDDAADVLNDLDYHQAEKIMNQIEDSEMKEEISTLRKFQDDCAGGLMSTEYFDARPFHTKKQILNLFKKDFQDIENIYDIFVLDEEGALIGICPIQNLLLAEDNLYIKDFMIKDDLKYLSANKPWKDVAHFMNKYNLINLAITDENHKMLGMVSLDDLMPWLLDERR